MNDGLIETASKVETPEEKRIFGVSIATVIDNLDSTNQGRVQLQLPWLSGYEPWARVAVPMAGSESGIYFIPQVGDEVLVAFNHGDVSDPFVIGSLWNGQDKPPAQELMDPVNKRMIKTPAGHTLVFDDLEQSITIEHFNGAKMQLTSEKIEISIGSASIKLEQSGAITFKGSTSLSLQASTIDVSADLNLSLSGQTNAKLDGGSMCSINAARIMIG